MRRDLGFPEAGFARGQGKLDAFGTTGGAGAVEHHRAASLVAERIRRVARRGGLVRLVCGDLAVKHESAADVGRPGHQGRGHVARAALVTRTLAPQSSTMKAASDGVRCELMAVT